MQPLTKSHNPVALVCMPFASVFQPSIALGLLQSGLAGRAIAAKSFYFNLDFAEIIGEKFYTQVSNGEPATYDLLGEWIFSCAVFEQFAEDEHTYFEEILKKVPEGFEDIYSAVKNVAPEFIEEIKNARHQVHTFVDFCSLQILAEKPRIVGFTSVFQQNLASLAVAKKLKSVDPSIKIIFGGANCEGLMGVELVQSFPFVDAVVSGEGDKVFPELAELILTDRDFRHLKGVYTKRSIINFQYIPNAESVTSMDSLPVPTYRDYFDRWNQSPIKDGANIKPRLLFETARGCWWGAKHHCTFCGLNGGNMSFRSKSPERAYAELLTLTAEHPGCPVSVVDNILDVKYFNNFIPQLAESEFEFELFYEVKANLKKDQILQMSAAGINMIQPGIESLSNQVLQLMRKGITGLQNIQLLKWCKEIGIEAFWNILWGFPGEKAEEYKRMSELLPLLSHLSPPSSASPLRLDRFSPNFDNAETLGFKNIEPFPSYFHIYELEKNAAANLAYFFTFEYVTPLEEHSYTEEIIKYVDRWKDLFADNDLFYVDTGENLLVWDLRECAVERLHVLGEPERSLYLDCDAIQTLPNLENTLQASDADTLKPAQIKRKMERLRQLKLIVAENDNYLGLAVDLDKYSPSREVLERFSQILQEIGQEEDSKIAIPINVSVVTEHEQAFV